MPNKMALIQTMFLAVFLFISTAVANIPCVPEHPIPGRTVCVCNATYCDTVDQVPELAAGQFVQYTSNKKGLRFEMITGSFEESPQEDAIQMEIALTDRYQTILGFGAAFTDAAGININSLSDNAKENFLRSWFSPDGIELNMARVPIGGCDFSTHPYAYAEEADDVNLLSFNLTVEDFELKIPLIKRAVELSEKHINFLAAAWSAPPWMKTNADYAGGYLKEELYQTWADYLLRFFDEYKKEGIEFWSVSTGNEPLGGLVPVYGFNSMAWTPELQFKWVQENFGPTLRDSQHRNIKILTSDDQRFMLSLWANALKNYTAAADYIDGFGVHWYLDTYFPPALLDGVHQTFPDKFILGTEACVGDKPWETPVTLGSWSRGELYMNSIMQDLHHWVGGWVDWNLALSPTGGPNWANNTVDAAVIVDSAKDQFYKQPMFYALGHFSKFVKEDSVRVGITPHEDESGIQSLAFQTQDEQVVLVIYNKNTSAVPVTITDPERGHLNLLISEQSFQTIVYNAPVPIATTTASTTSTGVTSSSVSTTEPTVTTTETIITTTPSSGSLIQYALKTHLICIIFCFLYFLI